MKTKLLIYFCLFTFSFCLSRAQVPQGFNYQAIARDGLGTLIDNKTIPVRVTIQTLGGTKIWEETHSVTTDDYGVMQLVVGNGTSTGGGSAASFSEINWSSQPLFLKTEVKYPDTNPDYTDMGTAKLWSVPYSVVAKDLGGPVSKLGVTGTTTNMEEAIFEVKNNKNQTVFAVYNEGVRVYVDDGIATPKGAKGGFAIGGFGTKGDGQEYLKVDPGNIRMYIDDTPTGKPAKGSFAIGGFGTKGGLDNYLKVDMDQIKAGKVDYLNITAKNTFIGTQSGIVNSTGEYNAFMGYNAGLSNQGGSYNVFIGNESGKLNTAGSSNVFLGFNAGLTNNASFNSFIGYQAGKANAGGQYNSFFGYNAGLSNYSGSSNVFIGNESGKANYDGSQNQFIGYNSGKSNTSGSYNVFMGPSAGFSNIGAYYNTFIGISAGYYNTWNDYNTYMGCNAGFATNSGGANTYLGTNAGRLFEKGSNNTFVGTDAGEGGPADTYDPLTTAVSDNNTFVGVSAGNMVEGGDNNVYIGTFAGASNVLGTGNVYIGNGAGSALDGTDNMLIIANSSGMPPLIYGDFSSTSIGLGTTTPGFKLDVVGDINISTGSNFKINGTNLSAATLGAEPALTKGNLTATGPISLNATRQVIGGAATISIADATTSGKGAVQLSNSYSGTSQTVATTEKALNDGLATKLTGNGVTIGKIFIAGGGPIVSTYSGQFSLAWDGSTVTLTNTSGTYCHVWWQGQNGSSSDGGSIILLPPPTGNSVNIVTFSGNTGRGYEIHFGEENGGAYCSVWLQYSNSKLFGHYSKY